MLTSKSEVSMSPPNALAPQLLVVTSANRRFFPYVLPYMRSTLETNSSCLMEIFVETNAGFRDTYRSGLAFLERLFLGRFLITEVLN